MHQVEACGQSLLLDCGLFQGRRVESRLRNHQFPFRPRDIDAVLLSHAHIDHCGNLPNLVRQGFAGPIYCTPATRALAAVMLGDAAKIQEEDAAYLNRKRVRGEPQVEPLYDGRDVYRTLLRLQAVPYDTPFDVGAGPGGDVRGRGPPARLGDGPSASGPARRRAQPDVHRRPRPARPADPARPRPRSRRPTCSSAKAPTAATRTSRSEETAERLGEVVRHTAERGGKLIIPAFSVGRTQTIVYFLHQLMSAGRLPDLPIYVDSPMAVRATEVFRAHPECFDGETLRLLREQPDLFGERRVHYVEKVHESIALNGRREPCVIISASGMCEAGRILHHLKHNIEDPRSTILIAGYQAPDTLGRRLVERRPEVRILGRTCAVKAEVVVLNGLSSHADHDGLLRSLGPLAGTTRRVRLVHGEPERAAALADALRMAGFADVAVPQRGESVQL